MKFPTLILTLALAGLAAVACWWWRDLPVPPVSEVPAPPQVAAPTPAQPTPPPVTAAPAPVPRTLDLASVPASIRAVVDPRQEFWRRMAVVHALSQGLATNELASLFSYLRTPEPDGDEKVRGGERVLRNDLLNALRDQFTPPAGLTALLAELSRDLTQSPVMRAYALQHLLVWYSRQTDPVAPLQFSPPEQEQMRQAFRDALDDPEPLVSGTSLLCLHRMAPAQEALPPGQLAASAFKLASNPEGDSGTRATALQICAERRAAEALPLALQLAQRADTVPLQIAAIAAVGDLGGPEQTAFLSQLAAGSDLRLQVPARAALQKLDHRLNN